MISGDQAAERRTLTLAHSTCACAPSASPGRWCPQADELFGAPGMHVLDVANLDDGTVLAQVESDTLVTGCPDCGLVAVGHGRAPMQVIEVNRPNRRARRLRGKADPLDAENAARRALSGEEDVVPKDTTTILESIRVLRIARTGAVRARTAAYNQLKDLLVTAPDTIRERWRAATLHRVSLKAARLRPDRDHAEDPGTLSDSLRRPKTRGQRLD